MRAGTTDPKNVRLGRPVRTTEPHTDGPSSAYYEWAGVLGERRILKGMSKSNTVVAKEELYNQERITFLGGGGEFNHVCRR